MDFSVGDIVQMKKSHPCGSAQWEILRTGIDFLHQMLRLRTHGHAAQSKIREKRKKNHPKRAIKTGISILRYPVFSCRTLSASA